MLNISVYVVSGLLLGTVLIICVLFSHVNLWDYVRISRFSSVRVWASPFECGCLFNLHPASYFGFSYLALLVFFVIFDLEVVLLLNLPFQVGLLKNFWYYFLFLSVLVVGYSVEASRGYANWGV